MNRFAIAAVAAVLASPAFAQSLAPSRGSGDMHAHRSGTSHFKNRALSRTSGGPLSAFGAVTPFNSRIPEANHTERETSIRHCSGEAGKTYPVRDSNWSLFAYRTCMSQHGHAE
jgi:hypothetical protein